MNIELAIQNYYNAQIKRYSPIIIEELCHLFGNQYRSMITSKMNNYRVFYCVQKRGLEKSLLVDDVDENEQKLITYFLKKIYEKSGNQSLYLGQTGQIDQQDIMEMMTKDLDSRTKYSWDHSSFCIQKITLYNGSFNNGLEYLMGLLRFISTHIENKKLIIPSQSFNLNTDYPDLEEKIYYFMLRTVAIMILKQLKEKGIHDFLTNPYLDKVSYDLLEQSPYDTLIDNFGDLLADFLINPNSIIDLLGPSNFTDFALFITQKDLSIDIEDVHERMLEERKKYDDYLFTAINWSHILNMLKELKEKEKQEQLEEQQMFSISLLIKYLEKYGNANLYFKTTNPNMNLMLTFQINEQKTLEVAHHNVYYDRSYFDGYEINPEAQVQKSVHIVNFDKEDLPDIMAPILYSSLNHRMYITTNRVKNQSKSPEIVDLYSLIKSMLNLDVNEYLSLTKNSDNDNINLFKSKAQINDKEELPNNMAQDLDMKIKVFLIKTWETKKYQDNAHHWSYEELWNDEWLNKER